MRTYYAACPDCPPEIQDSVFTNYHGENGNAKCARCGNVFWFSPKAIIVGAFDEEDDPKGVELSEDWKYFFETDDLAFVQIQNKNVKPLTIQPKDRVSVLGLIVVGLACLGLYKLAELLAR